VKNVSWNRREERREEKRRGEAYRLIVNKENSDTEKWPFKEWSINCITELFLKFNHFLV
jgi:hypothetical protein